MVLKKMLRENLEKVFIKENRNQKLIQIGMENSFDDESSAKNHLKGIMNKLNSLPQSFNLYRVVFLNKPSDLNRTDIGRHYVLNKKELEKNHQYISHVGGGKPYMLTVKVNKNNIDVDATLLNQMKYPHENEITMLNKGKGGSVIKVEPMSQKKSSDNFGFSDDFSDYFSDDFSDEFSDY